MTWALGFLVYLALGVEWLGHSMRRLGWDGPRLRAEIERAAGLRDLIDAMEQESGCDLDWLASLACAWVVATLILLWPLGWLMRRLP